MTRIIRILINFMIPVVIMRVLAWYIMRMDNVQADDILFITLSLFFLIIIVWYLVRDIKTAVKLHNQEKEKNSKDEFYFIDENFLNEIKDSSASVQGNSDNFNLIAQNVAAIYSIVDHSSFGLSLNKKQKLYATALIDMYAYLSRGVFTALDVAKAVDHATNGIISLFPYMRLHGTNDLIRKKDNSEIIFLVMQLEAMIFDTDTQVSSDDIINMIIAEKETITVTVNQVISHGPAGTFYKQLYDYVQKHINDPAFHNIVLVCENFQDDDRCSTEYRCKKCGRELTVLNTKCDYCGEPISNIRK